MGSLLALLLASTVPDYCGKGPVEIEITYDDSMSSDLVNYCHWVRYGEKGKYAQVWECDYPDPVPPKPIKESWTDYPECGGKRISG